MELELDGKKLIKMSTIAARNISISLGLEEDKVEMVEQAINDEFQALSNHFAFMIEDMRVLVEKTQAKSKLLLLAAALGAPLAGLFGFVVHGIR